MQRSVTPPHPQGEGRPLKRVLPEVHDVYRPADSEPTAPSMDNFEVSKAEVNKDDAAGVCENHDEKIVVVSETLSAESTAAGDDDKIVAEETSVGGSGLEDAADDGGNGPGETVLNANAASGTELSQPAMEDVGVQMATTRDTIPAVMALPAAHLPPLTPMPELKVASLSGGQAVRLIRGRGASAVASETSVPLVGRTLAAHIRTEDGEESASSNDEPRSCRKVCKAMSTTPVQVSEQIRERMQEWRSRRRLMFQLSSHNVEERCIEEDGNCQFAAISDQLFGTPKHHLAVRRIVTSQLRRFPDRYRPYVSELSYEEYVEDMSTEGEWGDHITLQAVADAYGFRVLLITSFPKEPILDIWARELTSERVVYLSFWAELHYSSLYPIGKAPDHPEPPSCTIS